MNNPTDTRRGDRLIRVLTALTVVTLGGVAAVVSFRHAYEVVRSHGETGLTAVLSPLTIDGLVFVASMVLLDSARHRQPPPALAKWALALGIGATVAVNVLHGIAHGPVGAVIAAWPALALVLTVELFMGMIRRTTVTDDTVAESLEEDKESIVPDPLLSVLRERFGDLLEKGEIPSTNRIKTEMSIGWERAKRLQSELTLSQSELASL